tara:strand:- start:2273 stop:2494 length:222 start_codon:yes stop_codon:yes gene_type:complete
MSSIKIYLTSAIVLSAVMLVGCISVVTDDEHGDGASKENQNHTFDVREYPSIDVTGFNGTVEIMTGGDGVVDV